MTTIFINGLGLIGSSIARIIRKSDPNAIILGNDINKRNCDYLLDNNIIDKSIEFEEGSKQADVIILASPVNSIIEDIKSLSEMKLKQSVIVTDVGSSKVNILKSANQLVDNGITFIGGHPMAGSHLTGSQNGSIEMLSDHTYFLVNHNGDMQQVDMIKHLLAAGNLRFKEVSAEKHDQIVSTISHLPHFITYALTLTVNDSLKDVYANDISMGNGLLDSTRIAKSNPDVWSDILTSNSDNFLDQIDVFEKQLESLKQTITDKKPEQLRQLIVDANDARNGWENNTK
ncbi:MAG: prephenate dehydrogenase/arogenate dehydrogenase family protein [Apilactobacillus sp.]|uniref:prephenate dehydrogenase n=1 Tax=Apilactobacillus nanyangensis TaxID=2799579 RepID=UPI00194401E8|nr:prephenate dehydrogenase/arogenate dehydrogenase family protein [Apilactobacillus nanyangensis]MCT6859019.1 prephenate dehydrogenase/arogenate dehydrogenase family protein [Apilactobacillus sp.]